MSDGVPRNHKHNTLCTWDYDRLTTQGLLASGGPRHRAADQWVSPTSPTADHYQVHQKQPQPQQAEFDYPLPLPPKLSRMNLPESALCSLEMSPSSSVSGSPRPLTDILNRINCRAGSGIPSGSAQWKLLQTRPSMRGWTGCSGHHSPTHYLNTGQSTCLSIA